MSEEITEAMGTVLGLIFGGLVLLVISAELSTSTSAIIEKWGVLFLIVALASAVVIVYTLIENLLGGLQ